MSPRFYYNTHLIAYALGRRFPNQTRETVVAKSPVSYQTFVRIERGQNVSHETLYLFGVSFLRIHWASLHDPELKTEDQFHRALLANGKSQAGSVRRRERISGSGRSRKLVN